MHTTDCMQLIEQIATWEAFSSICPYEIWLRKTTSVPYCMVCASVGEDSERIIAPTDAKPYNNVLTRPAYLYMYMHFVLCEMFDVKHWNTNERWNNLI